MRKIKLLSLAVAIFFVVIVAVAMAAPQLSSVPTPTFQARTRLVQVDVIVRNKNGPVMMLNQDDFTLLDNGKPQKISVFAVKGTPSSRQAAVPMPPGTVSNRVTRNGQEAASSTVVLIDRLNTPIPDQRYADQKIVKFLENRRSQDRIGSDRNLFVWGRSAGGAGSDGRSGPAEPGDQQPQDARWVGGVEISLYLEGAPSAFKLRRKIAIPDDQLASALAAGIVVEVPIGTSGATGDLRVVVQDDATGAGGSVRVPLGKK